MLTNLIIVTVGLESTFRLGLTPTGRPNSGEVIGISGLDLIRNVCKNAKDHFIRVKGPIPTHRKNTFSNDFR